MKYKIMLIYIVDAATKAEANAKVKAAPDNYLEYRSTKEVVEYAAKRRGFLGNILQQLFG